MNRVNSKVVYTVTQINNQVSSIFEDRFSNISVQGELSSYKKSSSGHFYFTLKDNNSEISCVMFATQLNSSKLSLENSQGLNIECTGRLSLYKPKGTYQLIVSKAIDKNTKGDYWKKFEEIKKKLKSKGYFDDSNKKSIPTFIKNVGIVTSKEGAVFRDVINITNRRAPYQKIFLSPSPVQGKESISKIINALHILDNSRLVDVIILARGGGAIEDLSCFNAEELALAIYSLKTPVISAVGHETDFTICDFIADLRASTPSEAAEIISFPKDDIILSLDRVFEKLNNLLKMKISDFKINLANLINRDISNFVLNKLSLNKKRIFDFKKDFNHRLEMEILLYKNTLDKIKVSMKGLNPNNVLNRGFSIPYDKNGNVIKSIDGIKKEDAIYTHFQDGSIKSIAKEKYAKEK